MAERTCPTCLTEVPAETFIGVGRRDAGPGDRTVCAYCGAISVIADDLSLRHPTDEELIESLNDQRVQVARMVTQAVRKGHL